MERINRIKNALIEALIAVGLFFGVYLIRDEEEEALGDDDEI